MIHVPIQRNWFENQYENNFCHRRSFLISDKPTSTERYRLKELLQIVHVRLSDFQDQLKILEKKKAEGKDINGPQEIDNHSSFEALLFWWRLLESKVEDYSRKMGIETDLGKSVRRLQRKIKCSLSN